MDVQHSKSKDLQETTRKNKNQSLSAITSSSIHLMPELRGLNEKKKYEVEVNSKFVAFYNNKGALGKCILRLQKNIVKITASYL